MITAEEISLAIDWIEKHPVIGAALIGSIAYTVKGIIEAVVRRLAKESPYAGATFWTVGKKYRVMAVHQYFPSRDAGYIQVQNSRPDQWRSLIEIKSSFMGCRHKVVPLDPKQVLAVVISRDGIETEKLIQFNK